MFAYIQTVLYVGCRELGGGGGVGTGGQYKDVIGEEAGTRGQYPYLSESAYLRESGTPRARLRNRRVADLGVGDGDGCGIEQDAG